MASLEEAQRRHALHYSQLLGSMKDEYVELADGENVVNRFETEWEQLQTAQAWAAGATQPQPGDANLASVFASHAYPLVGLRRRPEVLREWITPSLSHEYAIQDPGVIAEKLNLIGVTHYRAGEFAEARDVWLRALEMHRRFDASADAHYFEMQEAGYQANIGSAEERLGNLGAARNAYESARDVFQRLGEARQEGRAWVNLGMLHAEEDAHEEAIEDYRRAEQIATDAGDAEGRELALGAMGNSLAELERLDEARTTLETALALARGLGDRALEALRLGNLANVLLGQRDYEGALRQRSDALVLAREMGERRTEALQLNGIGQIHALRGEEDEAQRSHAEAEEIFAALGMSEAAARARAGAAGAAARQSLRATIDSYNQLLAEERYDEALAALDRWAAVGHEPTPRQRSMLLGLYGFAEHVSGGLERAAEHFAQALELDRELPQDELVAHHLANVGDFYRELGDARHAELVYRAALRVDEVPDALREGIAHALQLAQQLGAEEQPGGLDAQVARDIGLELVNRSLGDEPVEVSVTYENGGTITGHSASVRLGSGVPAVTLELAGGLPLDLAFGRIAAIRVH